MERRGLIVAISAGVGLLIVVFVGFLLPAGSDHEPILEEKTVEGAVSEAVIPRSARQSRTAGSPMQVAAPLSEEEKQAKRQEWASMSDEQREQFRSTLRQRLSSARRQTTARQARFKRRQAEQRNQMLKQRLEAMRRQEGGSPEVNMP